ncbi:hypothetical protein Nepgr_028543 [Nepenthes gracilis]|uniref:CID domain-containing protein n=1 Tax=Nepenthes gracilis TaxID=150966 RepID=A0AAD3Y423_NEPGR|nr:hypothetical protein Nepgr_028543 [Nepenthes gracilis]
MATVNEIAGTESFKGGRMSNDIFDVKILTDKLSKLNNSQQSIESLSHWCIFHREKARQIVETWEKLFNTSKNEQCVSFLYLANDILQNSRRKGSEFVNEFWKVLPAALKNVYENGDERAKKSVSRLVDIWEERKVFGSRVQSLKDQMLGKDPTLRVVGSGKSSNPIKIIKKDDQSLRIKVAIGGLLEKIVTAFHYVHDKCPNEEEVLVKCNAALLNVGRMEKDVDYTSAQGIQSGSTVHHQLQEQENILQQCVSQLETAEASRLALVSQLKEALQDQESYLGKVRGQLQAARNQIEVAGNMKQKLLSPHITPITPMDKSTEPTWEADHSSLQIPLNKPPTTSVLQLPVSQLQKPLNQPATFVASASAEEEKKAAAAAVAAKLTASTSSAQMLTSVLSSLVAEEAAAMNGESGNAVFASSLLPFSPEKRQKLELYCSKNDVGSTSYLKHLENLMSSMPLMPTSVQPMNQAAQIPVSLPLLMPLPLPLPLPQHLPPTSSPSNQFLQSAVMILGPTPYRCSSSSLPPPPPLPSYISMGLVRPPSHQPLPPQLPQPQPQPSATGGTTGGHYQPMGIGPYGQNHQPTTPPVHQQ